MYVYDAFDRRLLAERVTEFRDQVARRLSGELTEEEFKPLRLMNGVYLQLHAYMLRIAIPYGTLSTLQLRKLAEIARKYDRGYGHFTTRQNIQFHWIKLAELPDAMAELASVGMHGMQTSGNNVRNITTDQWPASRPTRLRIRASGPSSFANTSPCIPNFHSCRANSRLRSARRAATGRRCASTIWRYGCIAMRQVKPDSK